VPSIASPRRVYRDGTSATIRVDAVATILPPRAFPWLTVPSKERLADEA
jgi:hypothetical protein